MGAAGVLLIAVLLVVIVFVPQLVIDPRGLTRDQWLTHVQDLRTTILQGLGGLAVLAGAVVAALSLRETSRQNRAMQKQRSKELKLQRRGQTTERFSGAIEQLGQQPPWCSSPPSMPAPFSSLARWWSGRGGRPASATTRSS
jgi:hypothetical protein